MAIGAWSVWLSALASDIEASRSLLWLVYAIALIGEHFGQPDCRS